jgi:hypothetical protein
MGRAEPLVLGPKVLGLLIPYRANFLAHSWPLRWLGAPVFSCILFLILLILDCNIKRYVVGVLRSTS